MKWISSNTSNENFWLTAARIPLRYPPDILFYAEIFHWESWLGRPRFGTSKDKCPKKAATPISWYGKGEFYHLWPNYNIFHMNRHSSFALFHIKFLGYRLILCRNAFLQNAQYNLSMCWKISRLKKIWFKNVYKQY